METALLAAVRAAVHRHHLLERGDRVLVGVSGGPDSVALLHALTRLRPAYALELAVCHVHHGLRPEADREAAFVEGLGAALGCPVRVVRVAVPRGGGRSPEDAARSVRYAALARAAAEAGARRIALGHTADDQAETVLMRLLQGAGPRGLAGIPVRRGRVVRPLLEVTRAEVLAYLGHHGLSWVDDASNADPAHLRNRLRHQVLPLLRAQGWPRLPEALRRTARAAREAVEALDALLRPRLPALLRPGPGGWLLDSAGLAGLPPGAVKALLRLALAEGLPAGLRLPGLRAVHLDALAGLLAAAPGARVRLPGGLQVERARDGLWVAGPPGLAAPAPVAVPGVTRVPALGLRLESEVGEAGPARPPTSPWEAWFDLGALPGALAVRVPRPADRVVPFGAAAPVRVSRLLAAAGVARGARARWPLLTASRPAAGEEVLWVIGVRRGAGASLGAAGGAVLRMRAAWDPVDRHDGEDAW